VTRRERFRAWRHTRPFTGGLLVLLAGLELVLIPLMGDLGHGAIKLVIYIGIGGVFGVLIGLLLIAAGIMLWVQPVHRVFYGIASIVLGIVSFPASNLGGFFIGMLLAIIGGSIGFAWTPVEPAPAPVASARAADDSGAEGSLADVGLADDSTADDSTADDSTADDSTAEESAPAEGRVNGTPESAAQP
jgi:hypothetical protein